MRAPELHVLGRLAGGDQAQLWGRQAEGNPPTLRTHDRYGHRIDVVEYHPAYHELMTAAVGHPTLRLVRIAIGPFSLATHPVMPGEWREVDPQELDA